MLTFVWWHEVIARGSQVNASQHVAPSQPPAKTLTSNAMLTPAPYLPNQLFSLQHQPTFSYISTSFFVCVHKMSMFIISETISHMYISCLVMEGNQIEICVYILAVWQDDIPSMSVVPAITLSAIRACRQVIINKRRWLSVETFFTCKYDCLGVTLQDLLPLAHSSINNN